MIGGSRETLKLPTCENQISAAFPQGTKQRLAQQSSRSSVGVPLQGSKDNLQVSKSEVSVEVSLGNKVAVAACRQPHGRTAYIGSAEQSLRSASQSGAAPSIRYCTLRQVLEVSPTAVGLCTGKGLKRTPEMVLIPHWLMKEELLTL